LGRRVLYAPRWPLSVARPYPDGSFDAAYLIGVLGEIPDPAAALGELRRVLRPGGAARRRRGAGRRSRRSPPAGALRGCPPRGLRPRTPPGPAVRVLRPLPGRGL